MTPLYIDMCRQATELQEAWNPKQWDLVNYWDRNWAVYSGIFGISDYNSYIGIELMRRSERIVVEGFDGLTWLPSIEQLTDKLSRQLHCIDYYVIVELTKKIDIINTFSYKPELNCLLLMLLMYECYSKFWNDKIRDWVNIK